MARVAVGGKERHGGSFTRQKGSCSREVRWICLTFLPTSTDSRIVVGIYTKTGAKNSKYSWTREIINISATTTIHVQLFRHIFRDHYSGVHNQPMPGMRRFEVIAPWQFLCTASAPTFSQSGEAVLAPCDRAIFEALGHSVLSISMCMLEFVEKRGRKTATAEEDDDEDVDADADE